jgi:hypothetical protein
MQCRKRKGKNSVTDGVALHLTLMSPLTSFILPPCCSKSLLNTRTYSSDVFAGETGLAVSTGFCSVKSLLTRGCAAERPPGAARTNGILMLLYGQSICNEDTQISDTCQTRYYLLLLLLLVLLLLLLLLLFVCVTYMI